MAAFRDRIQHLKAEYAEVAPRYRAVAKLVRQQAEAAVMDAQIKALYEHRAKDEDSFVKKMFRKNYTSTDQVTDLAGVRIIVPSSPDSENVCSIMDTAFQVASREDKSEGLGAAMMGYRGTHFLVGCPSEDESLRGLQCEIQVRTRAEHLWSAYSHELFYKSTASLPMRTQRAFNRLAAMIEIFDEEVTRTMHYLEELPKGDDLALVRLLTGLFRQAGESAFDPEMTQESVRVLQPILTAEPNADAEMQHIRIQQFFEQKKAKVTSVFQREHQDYGNPVVIQPESILVWFLLEEYLHTLEHEWDEQLDRELLEDLAIAWGSRLPEFS